MSLYKAEIKCAPSVKPKSEGSLHAPTPTTVNHGPRWGENADRQGCDQIEICPALWSTAGMSWFTPFSVDHIMELLE